MANSASRPYQPKTPISDIHVDQRFIWTVHNTGPSHALWQCFNLPIWIWNEHGIFEILKIENI